MNKLHRKCWITAFGAVLIALVAVGCTQTSPATSPMEVTHASYLDLTGNISDLRSRVTQWQKGDEGSLNIAGEKLERIEAVLGSIGWPKAMAKAIARTKAAVGPMAKALKAEDQAAAEAASKEFGDASHDVTHAFYGDWLPELGDAQFTPMAAHVIYLDLTANISDLQTRVAQWEKGDEGSMNIAKEKAERIEALLQHMAFSGVMVRRLPAIEEALPAVFAAIEKKEVSAAQQALKPIAEASGDLTRDAYTWMDIVAGGNDVACVQASYLDLTRNLSELRAGVAEWQKGGEKGLNVAGERLGRIEILVAHAAWPGDMAVAIDRTKAAVGPMAGALKEKKLAAAEAASKEFGEASHDVTHSYYGDWLPSGQLRSNKMQTVSAGGKGQTKAHSDSHEPAAGGHEAATEGPNWPIVGGFVGILALVIGIAAVTKPRGAAAARVASTPEPAEG